MFQGRLYKSDGYHFEGGWSKGKKNGQGFIEYPNGDCFEGNWRNDLREGEGKYYIKKYNCQNIANSGKNLVRSISGIWKGDVMKSGVVNEKNWN